VIAFAIASKYAVVALQDLSANSNGLRHDRHKNLGKGELGLGGSDPSVQASFSYAKFYCSEDVSEIVLFRSALTVSIFASAILSVKLAAAQPFLLV
jgi:hypothetical protein